MPRYKDPDYMKRYRAENRERLLAYGRAYAQTPERRAGENRRNTAKRAALRAWCDSLKTAPCTDCGRCYIPYVMDWDHLPRSCKATAVGKMAADKWSRESILAEITKCELVCANCHRLRTYWRRHPLQATG